MEKSKHSHSVFAVSFFFCAGVLAVYFGFAATQGEYGVFHEIHYTAEQERLQAELDDVMAEVKHMRNKTLRLSDTYLDLDLLDERARDMLGMVRPEEIVIQ